MLQARLALFQMCAALLLRVQILSSCCGHLANMQMMVMH